MNYDTSNISYMAILGDDLDISASKYIDMDELSSKFAEIGF